MHWSQSTVCKSLIFYFLPSYFCRNRRISSLKAKATPCSSRRTRPSTGELRNYCTRRTIANDQLSLLIRKFKFLYCVYSRPGNTVQFRAIVLSPQLKPSVTGTKRCCFILHYKDFVVLSYTSQMIYSILRSIGVLQYYEKLHSSIKVHIKIAHSTTLLQTIGNW